MKKISQIKSLILLSLSLGAYCSSCMANILESELSCNSQEIILDQDMKFQKEPTQIKNKRSYSFRLAKNIWQLDAFIIKKNSPVFLLDGTNGMSSKNELINKIYNNFRFEVLGNQMFYKTELVELIPGESFNLPGSGYIIDAKSTIKSDSKDRYAIWIIANKSNFRIFKVFILSEKELPTLSLTKKILLEFIFNCN